jgi:sirohydrochlorin ferrochelatase
MVRSYKLHLLIIIPLLCLTARATTADQKSHSPAQPVSSNPGILLLAHGGSSNWNDEVNKLAQATDKAFPTEVAFGMATKRNMEAAIRRLVSRGADEIIAVPLFISPYSSVVTSSQYLLGLISEAPPDLARFARMSHGHGADDHSAHNSDPTKPIDLSIRVRMTSALGSHRLVAEILLSRAQSISREPREETVVLVAHGPVSDEENAKWLADMSSLAEQMKSNSPFRDIRFMTVRDDAPPPIRDQATAELRKLIEGIKAEKRRAIVVPLLLSYGGIEGVIKKRLEGLEYTIANQALLPDDRLIEWVLTATRETLGDQKVVGK